MENQFEILANRIATFLPGLLGALIVLLIGWLLARGIRALIIKLLKKTSWDERVFGKGDVGNTNVFVANILYYIIMIIVILIVLEILGIREVLVPLQNMVNQFLLFIPNLVAAILIGFIGYILAKFVSSLIQVGGGFLDRLLGKTGFADTEKLIRILRSVVFIIIFIPFLIQALNALQLNAISEPANNLLSSFIAIIGQILIAALVLFIFIWGGKLLTTLLRDLLLSLGLDSAAQKIQIQNMIGANQSLSGIIANLVFFFIVFFGLITASDILGLSRLTEILNQILAVSGQIIFGLVILAVGNYISLLIYNTMVKSRNNTFIAGVMRWASLALFIAIGLRTMGIANEIVELAFALTLGAIAVAVALSYGLGGRDAAGEHFRDVIHRFRREASQMSDTNNPPIIQKPDLGSPEGPARGGPNDLDFPVNPASDPDLLR
jgi:hypothetical protein